MSHTNTADLLALQGSIKRDPEGYADEFNLQYLHYKSCLDIFRLKPSKESREFGELVNFVAQVASCYPKQTGTFVQEVISLLDAHHALLHPALRQSLVKALILLRNRGQVSATELLPLFFRMFRCQDKALRQMLFRHIVTDIKASNAKHRDERLNRAIQNFLYTMLEDESEAAAKKSLSVLTELYRRHVWRDARTVNVIARAALSERPRVMVPALKFFLGQDERAAEEEGESSDDEETASKAALPSKQEYYKAHKKGTTSSKKKKIAKLNRVMATVRKQNKKEGSGHAESFAAIQLLHDPQTFAEKLYARLQASRERFETRLAMMQLVSRVVGVHRLLLLNFYPFLQRYLSPHQRDVTHVLAALIQACHELVPPETLAPVLRRLVDHFVSDRSRVEVMTVGLKTVRELCARTPLVMTPDLLRDLAAYRKFRDKEVAAAARGLIGLFREIAPAMLEKKDRGRGADLAAQPLQYGAAPVRERVEGAELLEAEERDGRPGSGSDSGSGRDSDEDGPGGSDLEAAGGSDLEEEAVGSDDDDAAPSGEGLEGSEAAGSSGDELEDGAGDSQDEGGGSDDEEGMSGDEEDLAEIADRSGSDDEGDGGDESGGEEEAEGSAAKEAKAAAQQQPKVDSLQTLKKRLADARAAKAARLAQEDAAAREEAERRAGARTLGKREPGGPEPLEYARILTEADFERIRELRHERLVADAMRKHGLKSASKRQRLLAAAEDEAEERMEFQDHRAIQADSRVNPDELKGRHKGRKTKEERLKSVLEGREGREFGSAQARKKQKSGGLSNKQKDKRKSMPVAARVRQIRKRNENKRRQGSKNFKGKKARTSSR